jgi:hypothetical protein
VRELENRQSADIDWGVAQLFHVGKLMLILAGIAAFHAIAE